jgi:hypothetical protein
METLNSSAICGKILEKDEYQVIIQFGTCLAYPPQTDGQTEDVNISLGNLLPCLAGENKAMG